MNLNCGNFLKKEEKFIGQNFYKILKINQHFKQNLELLNSIIPYFNEFTFPFFQNLI